MLNRMDEVTKRAYIDAIGSLEPNTDGLYDCEVNRYLKEHVRFKEEFKPLKEYVEDAENLLAGNTRYGSEAR